MRPVADLDLTALAGPGAAAMLHELRATTPVAWVPALDGWLVTRHDLALQVVRDAVTFTVDDPRFTTAQVVGPSMLSTDGTEHRRHRSPFGPPFRAAQLETRYRALVERLATGLVGGIAATGSADLRTALAGPLSVSVIAHALGLGEVDAATVLDWYGAIVAAVTALTAGEQPATRTEAAVQALSAAVRASLETGAGTVIADARRHLTDDEIVSNIQ